MTVTSYYINEQVMSVRLASLSNLSGIYYNGLSNNGVGATLTALSNAALSIDGVAANLGDRIFLFSQTNANENGIYDVTNPGSSLSKWSMQRSNDFQSLEQLKPGQYFTVSAGDTLAGNMFVLVEPLPSQIGIGDINIINVTGSSSGGPFLTVAGNLSDVNSTLASYQNLGFGGGCINLSDDDFPGGVYQLTNPPEVCIEILVNENSVLILPNVQEQEALTVGQSIFFQIGVFGGATFEIHSFEGATLYSTTDESSAIRFVLQDKSTSSGSWVEIPFTSTVNNKSGFVQVADVVQSWDGSTNPVDVTAGSGIDITNGVISLDGSGASAAYGFLTSTNTTTPMSFSGTVWQALLGSIYNNSLLMDNFAYGNDPGTGAVYLQYTGNETGAFQITVDVAIRKATNNTLNDYFLSYGINSQTVPVVSSTAIVGFFLDSNTSLVTVPMTISIELEPLDQIFILISNRTSGSTSTDNDVLVPSVLFNANKLGDVGGATAGVVSLNGLDGNVNITSGNKTKVSNPSGNNIQVDYLGLRGAELVNTPAADFDIPNPCPCYISTTPSVSDIKAKLPIVLSAGATNLLNVGDRVVIQNNSSDNYIRVATNDGTNIALLLPLQVCECILSQNATAQGVWVINVSPLGSGVEVTGTSVTLWPNIYYFLSNVALTTATLASSDFLNPGDKFYVTGLGAGLFRIQQAATGTNQTITIGIASTTTGPTGFVDSLDSSSSIVLFTPDGSSFYSLGGPQGNFSLS